VQSPSGCQRIISFRLSKTTIEFSKVSFRSHPPVVLVGTPCANCVVKIPKRTYPALQFSLFIGSLHDVCNRCRESSSFEQIGNAGIALLNAAQLQGWTCTCGGPVVWPVGSATATSSNWPLSSSPEARHRVLPHHHELSTTKWLIYRP